MAEEAQAPEQDPGFIELREAYESGELIVFVGAGVSAGAGLPSWGRLVTLLMDRARARRVDPEALREVEALVAKDHYIDALSELSEALGQAEFGTAIERAVDDRKANVPEAAHAIAALAPKLRAVLTTNLDHLLERAFAGRWPMFARAPGDLATRRGYILKLHGTLLERETWVMTREQYDRAMYADPRMATTFGALFHVCPILFVGYGLVDDDFDQLLARVRVLSGSQPPRHFALVPAERVTRGWRRRIESAGVRLITYPNPDRKHGEVARLLRILGEEPTPAEAAPAGQPAVRTIDDVRQVLREVGFQDPNVTPEVGAFFSGGTHLIERLLGLEGWSRIISERVYLPDGHHIRSERIFHVVLALREGQGFSVVFAADAMLFSASSHLTELSKRVAARGGVLRIYDLGDTAPPVAGVEILSLRDEVVRHVGESLRMHAQRCLTTWTDDDEQRFVAARARLADGRVLPVAKALDQALVHGRLTLVLGDFGAGKSTQLRRWAAWMAQSYLHDPARHPAPLWLPLTGLTPELGVILACHLPDVPVAALELAIDLELAVPLLDGFDELQFGSALGAVEAALVRLVTMTPNSLPHRVVISARETTFVSHRQLEKLLHALPYTTLLTLEDLDRPEVEEFVRKATTSVAEAEAALRKIAEVHGLGELAQRPALLDLIVRNHERLTTTRGELVTSVRLYEMAAEDWLGSREHEEKQLQRRQRLAFARALARRLWVSEEASVTYAQIVGLVAEVLGEAAVFDPSAATFEVQKAVFLAWGAKHGAFRFAHRSFLEYFLAVDVAERLAACRADALDLPLLRPEIVWFLVGIVGWEQRKEQLCAILRASYRPRVSENALFVLYEGARLHVGRDEEEALRGQLAKDIPRRAQLGGARLGGWSLDCVSLVEADLSHADLVGAQLRAADLTGARLIGAKAHHAVFDGALLDGADLSEADLFAASLIEASVAGVTARRAQLDQVIWLGVRPGRLSVKESDRALGEIHPVLPVRQDWGLSMLRHLGWSSDGRWLALAVGNAVHIVDAWSGALARTLEGHSASVWAVDFSPNGSLLASASADHSIRLWTIASGTMLRVLKGHTGPVRAVRFSPDGALLASASDDRSLRLWEVSGGSVRGVFQGHIEAVRAVNFSPDGALLASASADRSVRLWEVATGRVLRILQEHFNWALAVSFSPDGTLLASASADRTIHLYETATGRLLRVLEGHSDWILSLNFSPDGTLLASASDDNSVRLWAAASGNMVRLLEGRSGRVLTANFSPDGGLLASICEDGSLHLWDVARGRMLRTRKGDSPRALSVSISPDATLLASSFENGGVCLWECSSGKMLQVLERHSAAVLSVKFSPDGALLASAAVDGRVCLWKTSTGEMLQVLERQAAAVFAVSFSPDGSLLTTVSEDNVVHKWEISSGSRLGTLLGDVPGILSVDFSSDGALSASGFDTGSVRLREAASGKILHVLEGHSNWVRSVHFSSDGTLVASASDDGSVRIWDVTSGRMMRALLGHSDGVTTARFSPDGSLLASGAMDTSVLLWEVARGRVLRSLLGHTATVRSVTFSPNGSLLVSASDDGSVRLWRVEDGRCLAILHTAEDSWLCRLPDAPFFVGEDPHSRLVRFSGGGALMSASLWAPLFHRPDLVAAAIAGQPPDLAALGLGSYEACTAALLRERERLGLSLRRPRASTSM